MPINILIIDIDKEAVYTYNILCNQNILYVEMNKPLCVCLYNKCKVIYNLLRIKLNNLQQKKTKNHKR